MVCDISCLHAIPSCILKWLVFLCSLPHLSEFNVTFIKNNLLNIMCWHLPHKKTLCISIFIPLNYLIFETNKLQNLRKHTRLYRTFLLQTLWHYRGCLSRVNFNRFSSISELIKLSKNLHCFTFKLSLQDFKCLFIIKFFLCHNSRSITEKCIYLIENILCWAITSFEVCVDTYF